MAYEKDDYRQESDGTWTVCIWVLDGKEIKGIPTKALADEIAEALRSAHDKGMTDGYYIS